MLPQRIIPGSLAVEQLANGLELIILSLPDSPLVAVEIAYRVGSRDDPAGRGGLAHLFEHMLFQGSEHVGPNEHFAHLQRIGGVANASTSRDRTVYWEAVPAQYLDLALWLESDRLGFLLPGLAAETLETQRGVVLAERLERVDNQPWGLAGEMVQETLWPAGHPYHRPVIGHAEDIRAIELGDVRRFFDRHYQPANAVMAIVGGVEVEVARAAVERWFGALEAGVPLAASAAPLVVAHAERVVVRDRVSAPRVWISWPLGPASDPATAAAEVAAAALSDGRSSPLYHDLVRQRGVAQDAAAGVVGGDLASSFVLVATCRPGGSAEQLEAALLEHLAAFGARGPLDQDLRRAHNGLAAGLFGAVERADRLADLLCLARTRYGAAEALDALPRQWFGVDAGTVRETCATLLDPQLGSRVVCLPDEPA